jgi:hypothetical protein
MSISLTKESGTLFVVQVKGIYTFEDSKEVESKFSAEIDGSQKVKVLILAEQFAGWGKEGDWGDVTFFYENDRHIEKIAVVANDKWKDQLLVFLGADVRQAAVEFFPDGREEDARNWLQS